MTNPAKLPMMRRSLRNLFSRPATRLYPQAVRPQFAGCRGQVDIDPVACNYCNVCARRCPTAALWVARDQRQVEIDDLRCIACGICVDVCAKKAVCLSLLAPQAYAAGTAGAAGPSLGRRGWQGPPVTAGARNTPPAAETVGGQRATPTG